MYYAVHDITDLTLSDSKAADVYLFLPNLKKAVVMNINELKPVQHSDIQNGRSFFFISTPILTYTLELRHANKVHAQIALDDPENLV